MSLKLHKLIYDMPSDVYHGTEGTYSSTQLKDLLTDEETFIEKYIDKSVPKFHTPAFDVGEYFHTALLEPDKLKNLKVYPGKVRAGGKWKKFQKKYAGKTILTSAQRDQAEHLVELVKKSPISMGYLKKGKSEVSLFIELHIFGGEIYAQRYEKKLTSNGWKDCVRLSKKQENKSVKLVIKVRADSLGPDFILDLKSTSGNAKSAKEMTDKVKYYEYDLSASLYLDMFVLECGEEIKKFIWTFASKDHNNCQSHRAEPDTIKVGRKKYMNALFKLAECMKNGWEVYDTLGSISPHPADRYLLEEREQDLDLV